METITLFYTIELYKRSGNISILSFTVYRKLFKYSLLADNILIEELRYAFYIFLLKGPSFYLSRYIFLYNG